MLFPEAEETRSLFKNLYKSGLIHMDSEDKRIIDNNALAEKKLDKVLHSASFQSTAESSAQEISGEPEDTEVVDALLNDTGADSQEEEKNALKQEIEEARNELEKIRSQTDEMIAQAKEQTAEIQKKAYEEAREDGYRDGERQGRQEAEAVKAEYQQKLKELQAAFEKEERELEPRFIEALTGIYEHIFKVDLSDYHELVTTLLCNTMQKIEGCRNLLIHVSGNDYKNVKENKERLQKEAGGSTVSVEIAEDKTLSAGQAMIETENGVYDCSLDTELSELTRKLKLLSYEALK